MWSPMWLNVSLGGRLTPRPIELSMRIHLLYLTIVVLAIYAWRDWFVSLCGLIVMTALAEHTDMPRSVLGIQGMSPWNVLLLSILVPWLIQRHQQGLRFDMPRAS